MQSSVGREGGIAVALSWIGIIGLAIAAAAWAVAVNRIHTLSEWLVWTYLEAWFWVALFATACTSFGQTLLVRVLRADVGRTLESAVLSMAVGVVAFTLVMYAGGALGFFNRAFAVGVPLAFTLGSGRAGWHLLRRIAAGVASARIGPLSVASGAVGAYFLLFAYLRILSPDTIGYDGAWFHVKVAQDYARWGAIEAFPGDYSHAHPQLASLIYTWGYLVPGLSVPQRWILALHLEFGLVLWMLAAVSATIDRQLALPAPAMSWPILFLFPIFLYYGPCATADHILAFFCISTVLALLAFWRAPGLRRAALLSIVAGGALLVRYQAVFVLVPSAGIAAIACARAACATYSVLGRRAALRRAGLTFCVLSGVFAFVVAPHFVKNALFYRNPVYPLMMDTFASRPSFPDAALFFEHGMLPSGAIPTGTLRDKLLGATQALATFSLLPRENNTVAGSLFTLLLPALVCMRQRSASLLVVCVGCGAILVWALVLVDTRYLILFAPIFAAGAGAIAIELWRRAWWTRCTVIAAVALQSLWVADVAFSEHARHGLHSSMSLIERTFSEKPRTVLSEFRRGHVILGERVPRDAKLLMHTFGVSLGIDRDVFMDSVGFQGLIDYRKYRTPRQLYDGLRELGITHLVHEPNGGYASPTFQEDVLFHTLASRYGTSLGNFGGMALTELTARPPLERDYRVLSIGISAQEDGLYRIEELFSPEILPVTRRHRPRPERVLEYPEGRELLASADAVIAGKQYPFDESWKNELAQSFEPLTHRIDAWELYVRRQ